MTAAYDDSVWVQRLESLGLPPAEEEAAQLLLAGKDIGFRQGLLGSSNTDKNIRLILKALKDSGSPTTSSTATYYAMSNAMDAPRSLFTAAGTSTEAKTIMIVIPAVLHGDDIMHLVITFDGEEPLKEYLRAAQCVGLIVVDDKQPKQVVNKFAQLVPDGIYTHATSSKEAFARVLGETRHLQQSREDEFARALAGFVQHTEPDQGYELREDLRMQLIAGGKIAGHDVVIKRQNRAYVGSHKTFVKGAKPVKDIAERCADLAKLPNQLPAVVKPAFMVERIEPEVERGVQKACTDLKVTRFHCSGNAIKVVNSMSAGGRLLRF